MAPICNPDNSLNLPMQHQFYCNLHNNSSYPARLFIHFFGQTPKQIANALRIIDRIGFSFVCKQQQQQPAPTSNWSEATFLCKLSFWPPPTIQRNAGQQLTQMLAKFKQILDNNSNKCWIDSD